MKHFHFNDHTAMLCDKRQFCGYQRMPDIDITLFRESTDLKNIEGSPRNGVRRCDCDYDPN